MSHHYSQQSQSKGVVTAIVFTVVGVLCALGLAVALATGWVPGQRDDAAEGAPASTSAGGAVSPQPGESSAGAQPEESTVPADEDSEGGEGKDGRDDEEASDGEAPETDVAATLQAAVDSAVAQYGGIAGIAVSDGTTAISAGDDSAYPAWSTIKVPLAIAALRADPGQYGNAQAAITVSDNAAAQALHDSLPAGAADAVLAEGGAGVTLNMAKIRPEFTTFGQTLWSASQEATFAANLGCIAGSGDVVALMGQVTPEQAYGLGRLPGARFKGGWGPDPAGMYHVRQLGLAQASGGSVAFGVTVQPASGTYADAQGMANVLVDAVAPAVESMPVSGCF